MDYWIIVTWHLSVKPAWVADAHPSTSLRINYISSTAIASRRDWIPGQVTMFEHHVPFLQGVAVFRDEWTAQLQDVQATEWIPGISHRHCRWCRPQFFYGNMRERFFFPGKRIPFALMFCPPAMMRVASMSWSGSGLGMNLPVWLARQAVEQRSRIRAQLASAGPGSGQIRLWRRISAGPVWLELAQGCIMYFTSVLHRSPYFFILPMTFNRA